MKRNFFFKVLGCISLLVLISGCGTKQIKNAAQIEAIAIEQSSKETNPRDVLQKSEENLAKAIADDLEIYSPLHIERAIKSISDAKLYEKDPPKDLKNATLMSAIAANKYIEQAYKNKKLVIATLSEAVKHLTHLKKLGAVTVIDKEYQEVLAHFKEEAKRIEAGEVSEASRNQEKLIDLLVEAQINALKQSLLGVALLQTREIEELDGEKYVPSKHAAAMQSLNKALQFIETNFRDKAEVESLAKAASIKVAEVYFIASEAEKLSNLNDKELGDRLSKHFFTLTDAHNVIAGKENAPLALEELANSLLASAKSLRAKSINSNIVREPLDKPDDKNIKESKISNTQITTEQNLVSEDSILPGFDNSTFVIEAELKSDEESFDDEESF